MKRNLLLVTLATLCWCIMMAQQSNEPKLSAVSTNKQAPGQSAQSDRAKPEPVLAPMSTGSKAQQAKTEKKQAITTTPKMAATDKNGVILQDKK